MAFSFKKSLLDKGCDLAQVEEWLRIRSKKKAVDSEHAFKTFLKECEKANISPSEAVSTCIDNQWKGFKAQYLDGVSGGSEVMERHFKGMQDKDIGIRVANVMIDIWGGKYQLFLKPFDSLKSLQSHWKNYIPYLKENIERLDQAKDRITRDRIAGNTNLDFPSIPTILQYMGPVKSSEVKKYREPTQEERENQKVVVSKLKDSFNENT